MNTAVTSTIHVVEDDDGFRAALGRMLTIAGYHVVAYRSAQEFLDASPAGPGCLLLDLQLPDLSGIELQGQLVERHVTLPIVFLTGHGSVRTSVQAVRAGAEDFLTKPVEEPDLLAAIQRALARDLAQRESAARLDELRARYDTLSPNERRVMAGVISGHLNKQIAYQFGRDLRTIKTYRSKVLQKMQADSTADLVRMAGLLGIAIQPPDA
jgi:FixJ family two-component response regulator